MNSLRIEADGLAEENEKLKAKVKELEQANLSHEQEITSLQHKNGVLESNVEKLESGIQTHKAAADESAQHGSQNEALQRKLQMLEEEAETADRNLRETNEKSVAPPRSLASTGRMKDLVSADNSQYRLRQTDLKAGHIERKVQALESERDQWEQKFVEMEEKYKTTKKELDDFVAEIGNI